MFRISLPGKMTFPFILVFLFCFAVMNRFIVAVLASTPFEDVSIEDDSTRVIHKWVSSTPEKPVPAKSSSALMSRYSNVSLLLVWFAEATDPIGPVLPSLFLPALFLLTVFLPTVFQTTLSQLALSLPSLLTDFLSDPVLH